MPSSSRGQFTQFGLIPMLLAGAITVFLLIVAQRLIWKDQSATPLLEMTSSGGYVTEECMVECFGSAKLYDDGHLVVAKRGGEMLDTTLDAAQVERLKGIIKVTTFSQVFLPKEGRLCPSAYDAIDQEISVRLSNGRQQSYSNCDYEFVQDQPFLEEVSVIAEKAYSLVESED